MFGIKRQPRRRPAVAGEYCTCGRPAVVVFASPGFGEVGSCLGEALPVKPCPFCGTAGRHAGSAVCPSYVLRPAWGTERAQQVLAAREVEAA